MKHEVDINDGDLQFIRAEVSQWRTVVDGLRLALEKIANLNLKAEVVVMGVTVFRAGVKNE